MTDESPRTSEGPKDRSTGRPTWPSWFPPQQYVEFPVIAQVCSLPVATSVNGPPGTAAGGREPASESRASWPEEFRPQQTRSSAVDNTHVCPPPAATCRYRPAIETIVGTLVCP